MGGTLIPDTTLKAMRTAANDFVDLKELQKAAVRVISEITHADDGYIVSGCAAGLMVSAAAIITGTDEALIEQLPYVQGGQVPCVAKRFARAKNYKGDEYVNHGYAMAVKTAGVKFVEIGEPDEDDRPTKVVSAEEYDQAFVDNPDAKMVYWVGYAPPEDIALEDVIDIAHAHGARVIIDASNCLPPRENLYRFIDIGADVVCYSGGKGIQGPQGSGIIAGDQDLIDAIAMQSAPSHGIGRVAKVSKEEVVGQVASFIWWANQDDEERLTEHHRKTAMLHTGITDLAMVADSYIEFPDEDNRPMPNVHVEGRPLHRQRRPVAHRRTPQRRPRNRHLRPRNQSPNREDRRPHLRGRRDCGDLEAVERDIGVGGAAQLSSLRGRPHPKIPPPSGGG